ncbi:MAG: hypothetical protein K8L97_09840 [Anaerolineae bacterium]|nr:hypothetical protein [Anaerolineae bacterium]
MTERLHPIFHRDPTLPPIGYDALVDEFEAAKAFGWTAYWNESRENRILMVAETRGLQLLRLMSEYDTAQARRT